MTALHSSLDTLSHAPSQSTSYSAARSKLRTSPSWVSKLDVVNVLGGEGEEGHGSGQGVYGHAGCINALSWSSDGGLLASGSDDKRICIWKMGQEPSSVHPDNPGIVQHYPSLGMGLSAVIHTGHRANIFSVKFSPTSTNVLFSCAGDHEVRCFDLSLSSSISSSSSYRSHGREWTEYPRPPPLPSSSSTNVVDSHSALTRVFKCHRGRVKRIATEENSGSTFLTCSEDGSVRQHDLRVGHVCKRDCPPTLCDYRPMGMGLYSLTTTPLRPELFVVAGTSPYAYLHDRRMIPKTMKEQWGVPLSPTSSLTQCVRRFGPAVPPLVPSPSSRRTNSNEDEDSESEEEEEDVPIPTLPPHIAAARARARRARAQTRAMKREEESQQPNGNVSAAKLSAVNGRELLLSYMEGGVCLYDIFDDPEEPSVATRKQKGKTSSFGVREKSRLDRSEGPEEEEEEDSTPHTQESSSTWRTPAEKRNKLELPKPTASFRQTNVSELEEAALPRLEIRPEERSDFVASITLAEDASMVPEEGSISNSELEETYTPAPESTAREGRTAFEIRVSDDGELEMDVGRDEDSVEQGGEMNGEGLQQLLENTAAATVVEEEIDEDEDLEDIEDDNEDDDSDMEEDDDEDEDEEDISSSDDPDTATASLSATTSSLSIPLVRPQKIYTGHRNVDTVKDVNFGGGDDSLVISGSDDGNVFIYSKATCELIGIYKGDDSVVNVMQWHPTKLPIMAVSGIDNSVKILAPTNLPEKKFSRTQDKEEIMKKNKDPSWTSQRLMGPPSSVLLNLLSRAAGAEGDEEDGGDSQRRRIPLAQLLQLAREGGQQGDEDCRIM